MKELIHFTQPNSEVCDRMEPVIKKLIKDNPDISYVKIDVSIEHELHEYYAKKYPINFCPAFLGLVDGVVQDGHVGEATQLVLESLVN
jgi:thiol-disulfide isomerase/thioredoxin